jgi:hypothetical protein
LLALKNVSLVHWSVALRESTKREGHGYVCVPQFLWRNDLQSGDPLVHQPSQKRCRLVMEIVSL